MMSDKIAVMIDGYIAQYDTPKNLYENPHSKEVANSFGERNYIFGNIDNGVFKSDILNIDLNIEETIDNVELMISKEDINICNLDYNTGIEGKIEKKVYAGDITYYNVRVKDSLLKLSSKDSSYEVGQNVKLEVDLKNIIYFK
jgi:ABC-type Fe3+/spermidine/putrescine transport system ATPase subunit